MNQSDADLVEAARRGSEDAFEQLMCRYQRLVFTVAFSYTRDRESALDATQEVLVKVHRGLNSLRAGSSFRAWLLRIAANEARNLMRGGRLLLVEDEPEEVSSAPAEKPQQEEDLMRRQRQQALLEEMRYLNPRQKAAVTLRYFQEMPLKEIAVLLECSEGMVKNLLYRSLRKLQTSTRLRWEL